MPVNVVVVFKVAFLPWQNMGVEVRYTLTGQRTIYINIFMHNLLHLKKGKILGNGEGRGDN